MPNPFISRQDLTDYLGRDVTTDDGALACVDAACDIVRTLSEQTFNRATSTEVFDGTGTDALLLPELPVNSVGSVTIRTGVGQVTTVGSADYSLNGQGMLLATNTLGTATWLGADGVWPKGRQNITLTYDHGYADADLPRDVRMVALSIASRLIVQGVAQFEVSGGDQVRYGVNSTDLTNGEMAILRKYRQAK